MRIETILNELNLENGSNYKIAVLKKYANDELLKRVFALTFDRVKYNFGVGSKTLDKLVIIERTDKIELDAFLNTIETQLCTRAVTGNAALDLLSNLFSGLTHSDRTVAEMIIKRDLRINLGRTSINKVFKNLISKPVYQRCGIFTKDSLLNVKVVKGTFRKINFKAGAYLDLKADGTYREMMVSDDKVEFHSRSGEEYEYPLIANDMKNTTNGRYFGELTVKLDENLLNVILTRLNNSTQDNADIAQRIKDNFANGKYILPRSLGNGIINSDDVPHENLVFDVWEYVSEEEYYNAANKITNKVTLKERRDFLVSELANINSKYVKHIEFIEVYNIKDAFEKVSEWMNNDLEGGVIKNKHNIFRDGTHPEQLKIKLEIELEVRVTGFSPGRNGTKRELTFGAIEFMTDDGKISGRTSGISDETLEKINENREEYLNTVMSVKCNDITKAINSETFALSHPRFVEFRFDKDETDTLERALEQKESSKLFEVY